MERYKIAGLTVDVKYKSGIFKRRSEKYKIENDAKKCADIVIDTDFDAIQKRVDEKQTNLSYNALEYLVTGSVFYRKLLSFNGFMLHSSAVVLDGYAYLFSAPCGTGKSTHTALWEKYFENAYVINDDKPAIKLEDDGGFYVYGTPWSGKSDKNVNARAKLGAICFLERSEENFIEKIESKDAVQKIVWQTVRPTDTAAMVNFMTLADRLLRNVNVYRLGCRMDFEAVKTAYNAMKP